MKSLTDTEPVSTENFRNVLSDKNDMQSKFALMYMAGIMKEPSKMVVRIINNNTNDILNKLGYKWSKLDDNYVQMYNKIGGNDNDKK